jgi:hypothetical protein
MRSLSYLFASLLCAAGFASAAEPVTVLGLPLGGKLKMPIRQCSTNELGTDVKSLCWVEKPFAYKDSRLGGVIVPGSASRPKWAAHASFEISVKTDGTLEKISVESFSQPDDSEINKSVTARWGQSDRGMGTGTRIEWKRPEIYVGLFCYDRKCKTDFLSPANYAEWMRELDARKRKDARRPVSP